MGILLAFSIAGAADLALTWQASEIRGHPHLLRLTESVMEGGAPGLADITLLFFLPAGVVYGLSFLPGAGRRLQALRSFTGRVFLVGVTTILLVKGIQAFMARPWPLVVLSGQLGFHPWFQPGDRMLLPISRPGAFPALAPALSCALIAWERPNSRSRLLWIAVAMWFVTMGWLVVYAQLAWLTDVLAGGWLGLSVAAFIHPRGGTLMPWRGLQLMGLGSILWVLGVGWRAWLG